ncbi:MAG TPA: hypothetical protein V6D50_12520 [Chroococcales cyanobacterium]|jgi:hypothetical protein
MTPPDDWNHSDKRCQGFRLAELTVGVAVLPIVCRSAGKITIGVSEATPKVLRSGTEVVSRGSIWELEQIKRAVQLGLSASSPEPIELVAADGASRKMADQIQKLIVA